MGADESKIILVGQNLVKLADGPTNVLIVAGAVELAVIGTVEAAPAVAEGAKDAWKAARANLKFDGPSPGFAFGNGRAFAVRWGKYGIIRVDLHPMNSGAPRWHVHLFSVGEEHGIRIPLQ